MYAIITSPLHRTRRSNWKSYQSYEQTVLSVANTHNEPIEFTHYCSCFFDRVLHIPSEQGQYGDYIDLSTYQGSYRNDTDQRDKILQAAMQKLGKAIGP